MVLWWVLETSRSLKIASVSSRRLKIVERPTFVVSLICARGTMYNKLPRCGQKNSRKKRTTPQRIRKGQPTPGFPRRVRGKASYPTDHPFPERSIAARSMCWKSSRNNGKSECFVSMDILVVFWAKRTIMIISMSPNVVAE